VRLVSLVLCASCSFPLPTLPEVCTREIGIVLVNEKTQDTVLNQTGTVLVDCKGTR